MNFRAAHGKARDAWRVQDVGLFWRAQSLNLHMNDRSLKDLVFSFWNRRESLMAKWLEQASQ